MKNSIIIFSLLLTGIHALAQTNRNSPFLGMQPDYSSFQYTGELGINAGLTAFLGDLGGTRGKGKNFVKDLNGVSMRPHIGISYAYYPLSFLKLMATLNYTTLTGADSVIKSKFEQSQGRYDRNLSFRSRIEEFALSGELYPLQLFNREQRETLLKPFIGVGVGVFHFDPEAELNGSWIKLQPLKLEGEGFSEYPDSKEYKLYQFYIPFNFGFKYRFDDNVSVGFQATFRKTFSDYLDDVSNHLYIDPTLFEKYLSDDQAALAKQLYYRGDPNKPINKGQRRSDNKNNDSYTTLAITFAYNLGAFPDKYDRGSNRRIRVRRFRF